MRPHASERELHCAVADMLAAILGPPGVCNQDGMLWLTIEQAERDAYARMERARRGVVAGFPDISLYYASGQPIGIELKTRSGVLSDAQRRLHAELRKAGWRITICRSCAAVLGVLASWGIPHRPAQLGEVA